MFLRVDRQAHNKNLSCPRTIAETEMKRMKLPSSAACKLWMNVVILPKKRMQMNLNTLHVTELNKFTALVTL